MKTKHVAFIALALAFISSVVLATAVQHPVRSAAGIESVPQASWTGSDGGTGYFVRPDAGMVFHAGNGTEAVVGTIATYYGTVKDEGSSLTQRQTLNFTGAGISCVDNSGSTRTDCTVSGVGVGNYQTVQSNGSDQTQRSKLNFSALFTASDSSSPSRTNITLAATGVTATTYGDASHVGACAVTAQGQITSCTSTAIALGDSAITYATESANRIFAGPTTGAAAAPTYRALVAADFPATTVSASSYGDASHTTPFTVDAAGRLTAAASTAIAIADSAITYATQTTNKVFAAPSGSTGAPTFRALVAADMPNTAVSAGSCTSCDLTIDAAGHVTAKANGSGGGSTGNYTFSSNAVDLTGAAVMSIAPTTATGVTIGKPTTITGLLKATNHESTSSAPSFSNGASGILGTPTSTSVTGTNAVGVFAFTTGTVGSVSSADPHAAASELFKLTFASYTATTGCSARFYPAGADNDTAAMNFAKIFDNFNNNNFAWSVCTTGACSLYFGGGSGAGGFVSTTAYKGGYQIMCW